LRLGKDQPIQIDLRPRSGGGDAGDDSNAGENRRLPQFPPQGSHGGKFLFDLKLSSLHAGAQRDKPAVQSEFAQSNLQENPPQPAKFSRWLVG
jgi:hypothetical protein